MSGNKNTRLLFNAVNVESFRRLSLTGQYTLLFLLTKRADLLRHQHWPHAHSLLSLGRVLPVAFRAENPLFKLRTKSVFDSGFHSGSSTCWILRVEDPWTEKSEIRNVLDSKVGFFFLSWMICEHVRFWNFRSIPNSVVKNRILLLSLEVTASCIQLSDPCAPGRVNEMT